MMKLGAFSLSLNVKNVQNSYAFYRKLGFEMMGGNLNQKWVIMRSEQTVIGLFEGMIDEDIITFNPGWNQEAENIEVYDDVRHIQKHLIAENIELIKKANEETEGPEHIMLRDPDGHLIMFDQHR